MRRSASEIISDLEIRVARLENKTASVDEHMARDLEIWILNDFSIYGMLQDNKQNIAKHMSRGRYDKVRAIKAMYNVVNTYLPTYKKNVGSPYLRVNKQTKMEAAKGILETEYDEIVEMSDEILNQRHEDRFKRRSAGVVVTKRNI